MLRVLTALLVFMLPGVTVAAEVEIDRNYCEGRALVAKATAEARDRNLPLGQWQTDLTIMKVDGPKDGNNLLYRVLPKALGDIKWVYDNHRQSPVDVYISIFNSCMSSDLGKLVALN